MIEHCSTSFAMGEAELSAVKSALAAGNKVAAIKALRAATGIDLAAAKNAVEAIESGIAPRSDKLALTGAEGERIKAALLAGKKVDAIRLFREATGADLKTSHAASDTFALHLEAAGSDALPTNTSSATIPLRPTISRGSGHGIQIVWALAVIALLAFMLWKFTF